MKRLAELMDLTDRVAVVIGGTGHVGAACGDALAELGANVVVVDQSSADAAERAQAIVGSAGVPAIGIGADITQQAEVEALPGHVRKALGRVDVVVNAAALVGTSDLEGWAVPFERQSPDTWRMALETNLTACFTLSQAFVALLRASGHGAIVNIASIYGVVGPDLRLYEGAGMGNPAAYAASKGGLIQLTRWLATVLAPEVRVNAVTPGGILRGQDADFQQRYTDRTPLGRMATEDDLKGAVAYLASDLSAYVTGHNLIVDGGWTAW